MHRRTKTLLQRLSDVKWYDKVGVLDSPGAIVLSSWELAAASCSREEWEDMQREASNDYCSKLLAKAPDRFIKWNDIVDDVKPTVESLVTSKINEVALEKHVIKIVLVNTRWDILHACMESEYADVEPPNFYADLMSWYLKGHFPCGWEPNPPPGKLIVY